MIQAEHTEAYEQVLLSYTAMCYSVALALTRNPVDAQCLTRDVLIEIWHLNDHEHSKSDIKKKLLTTMREKFKGDYLETRHGLGNQAALAERM